MKRLKTSPQPAIITLLAAIITGWCFTVPASVAGAELLGSKAMTTALAAAAVTAAAAAKRTMTTKSANNSSMRSTSVTTDTSSAATVATTTASSSRPTMHTFFERIDDPNQRFTGMTDEEDDALLEFWKESWTKAGWNVRILTLADAQRAPQYTEFRRILDEDLQLDAFSRLLLERWMAMASVGAVNNKQHHSVGVDGSGGGVGVGGGGGGWFVDYDVFPLRPFDTVQLPHDGAMTVYDKVAPTMASGNATEWLRTAMAIVENARIHCNFAQKQKQQQQQQEIQRQQRKTSQQQQQQKQVPQEPLVNFWTDTLGLIHLIRNTSHVGPISKKLVLAGQTATSQGTWNAKDVCQSKPFRSQTVVHFGPTDMQRGRYIAPQLRLPRHRVTVAKEWLARWYQICNIQWQP